MPCKLHIKQSITNSVEARIADGIGKSPAIARRVADRVNKYFGTKVVDVITEGDYIDLVPNIPDSLIDAYYNHEVRIEAQEKVARQYMDDLDRRREGNWTMNEDGDIVPFFDQRAARSNKAAYERARKLLDSFFRVNNISIETTERLPNDAVARIDLFNKLIEVVEGRADATTLSEEAAHFMVAAMQGTDEYNRMMRNISKFDVFNEVLQTYPDYSETKQREEAVGKLIGRLLGNEVDSNVALPQELKTARSWWQMIKDFFLNLFKKNPDAITEFKNTASAILKATPAEIKTTPMTLPSDIGLVREFEGTIIEYVDHIGYHKGTKTPIAARNIRKGEKIIMALDVMRQKYKEKAWTKPVNSEPLPEDAFNSFEEFVTFAFLHEKAHEYILQEDGESKIDYETRINNEALRRLKSEPAFVMRLAEVFEQRTPNLEAQKRVLKSLEKTRAEVQLPDDSNKYLHTPTGKVIRFRVSDIVKRKGNAIFGVSEFKDDADKAVYLNKGTVVHLYNQLLMERYQDGTIVPSDGKRKLTIDQKNSLKKEIMSVLKPHPQFADPKFQKDTFYDLGDFINTLYDGTSSIYQHVKEKDENAVFLTEQIIYDPAKDTAGTIDLLVVWSDGSVSIYDYKTTQLKRDYKTGDFQPIIDNKRQMYEIQVSEYKDMLINNYGVDRETGFRELRILPIHIEYFRDETGMTGDIVKASPDAIVMTSPYLDAARYGDALKQITVAGELTDNKNINELLEKLYKQRDFLRRKLRNKFLGKEERARLQLRLENIQKTIDAAVVDQTITTILNRLESIAVDIENNLSKLGHSKLLEYNELLNIFQDFNINFRDLIKNKDEKIRMALFNDRMEQVSVMVKQAIIDRHIEESGREDILEAGKPKSFWGRLFDGVVQWSNPAFQRLGEIAATARERKRLAFNRAEEEIRAISKKYLKWANANGMSGLNVYDPFINKNTGNLVTEFSKEFYEDKDKASEALTKYGDTSDEFLDALAWFEKYYVFDYDAHKESVKRYEKILNEDPSLNEKERERKLAFVANARPDVNPLYWVKNARYVKPKPHNNPVFETSTYINDQWLRIQNTPEMKEFYDMYTKWNNEMGKLVGYDIIGKNFVPNIRSSFVESMSKLGIGAAFQGRNELIRMLEIQEYDEVYGIATDSNNRPVQQVPLLFTKDLRNPATAAEKQAIEAEAAKKYDPDSTEYRDYVEYEVWKLEKKKGIEAKSKDLASSLVLMVDAVYNYHYMDNVKDAALTLRELVTMQKEQTTDKFNNVFVNKVSKRASKMFGVSTDTLKAFDEFLNYHIFQQTLQGKDQKLEFGNEENPDGKVTISGSKAIRQFMNLQSVISIGFSPVIATANFVQGKTSAIISGKKGTFYNSDNMKKAIKLYGQRDLKALGLIKMFEPTARNLAQEKALRVSASTLIKTFNLRNVYALHRGINTSKIADKWGVEMPMFGDENVDNSILIAMADNYVVDSDGKLRSKTSPTNPPKNPNAKTILELMKVDEETMDVSVEGLTDEQFIRFRRMVQEAASEIKGSSSADQQNAINFTILGQVFTHFRNWLPHLARERFGDLRYNDVMGEVMVGRYSVAMGEILHQTQGTLFENIKETVKDLALMGVEIGSFGLSRKVGIEKKINVDYARMKLREFNEKYPNNPLADPELTETEALERFVELRRRHLRAFMFEAQIVLGFLLLISAGMAAGFDDEDEVGIFANSAFKMLKRSYLEVSFFMSLDSVDQIIKAPVASWTMVTQLKRMMSNAIEETAEWTGLIEENKKDRTPLGYYTLKMIPAVNQILGLLSYFPTTQESDLLDKILYKQVFK